MPRTHMEVNVTTGVASYRAYTTAEETAVDAQAALALATPPPAPVNILLAPATIASFASVAGAAFSYQNLTVPGLLATDTIVRAWFSADFAPATITYEAERVAGANSLRMRFQKISTGAVVPTANQVLNVQVSR